MTMYNEIMMMAREAARIQRELDEKRRQEEEAKEAAMMAMPEIIAAPYFEEYDDNKQEAPVTVRCYAF